MDMSLLQKWLGLAEKRIRRAPRLERVGLNTFYWDGAAPQPRRVKNISTSGAYFYTPERWYVGTLLRLSLQVDVPSATSGLEPETKAISVVGRVVRQDAEGIGVRFLTQDATERKALTKFIQTAEMRTRPKWILEQQ